MSCLFNLVAFQVQYSAVVVAGFTVFCKESKILGVWSFATCVKGLKSFLVDKIIFC